jgi:hypothetical protein
MEMQGNRKESHGLKVSDRKARTDRHGLKGTDRKARTERHELVKARCKLKAKWKI